MIGTSIVASSRSRWDLTRYLLAVAVWALGAAILVSPAAAQTEPASPQAPANQPSVQLATPPGTSQTGSPVTITLRDALDMARKIDSQFLSALSDAESAAEDRVQAKAALLPSVSSSVQYLGTQGNGTLASGRYVSNDGVHLYRAWGVFHQDLSPVTLMGTGLKRASAAEAVAKAKAEVASRGLAVTVTKDYYSLLASQRKYATAQQALGQARHFLDIAQQGERLQQVAHSDAVKAEIQFAQQQQAFDEAQLAMESDRLNLAVLLFPSFNENFTVVDDMEPPQALPKFPEIQEMAERENPDMRVAVESLKQADLDVTAARHAFLPSITLDTDYGIEANAFALHSEVAAARDAGKLPNLGYFVTASVTLPVWDWGTLRSKLHQSQLKRQQAQVELSKAQRQMVGNLYAFFNEATVAHASLETLHHTADLAAESLRLVNLRYQAGESTALEVVDALNTSTQARNAYDDAGVRYRVAIANLQTLTGSF